LDALKIYLDSFSSNLAFYLAYLAISRDIAFRELRVLPPKTLGIATTAVTFPVLEFSIAISLALIVSSASLVASIGQVSVDSK